MILYFLITVACVLLLVNTIVAVNVTDHLYHIRGWVVFFVDLVLVLMVAGMVATVDTNFAEALKQPPTMKKCAEPLDKVNP